MNEATVPIDSQSRERLEAGGLRLGLVDTSNRDDFAAWIQAEVQGFHGPQRSDDELEPLLRDAANRRTTGVWDGADPLNPVATISSWATALSVPAGGTGPVAHATVPAWAVSSVTVSPTHRRKGIARAILEAELRTAAGQGIPLVALTVSEATIYGRYGFGAAAFAQRLTIDTRRARFTGPQASGRLRFITVDELAASGRQVCERARLRHPGEIELDDALWGGLSGSHSAPEKRRAVRLAAYDDETGTTQGYVRYKVTEKPELQEMHEVEVLQLVAATDEAYAALWRFVLDLDLVVSVSAPLRPVDEPLVWQLSDLRGASVSEVIDHLWLRVLDAPAALEARRYSAPGRFALAVTDPLGFADGRILVSVDASGRASVETLVGDAPADAAELALGVGELGSLYLGGVSAVTLARAGRIRELRPGSAAALDVAFRSPVTPWLSIWF